MWNQGEEPGLGTRVWDQVEKLGRGTKTRDQVKNQDEEPKQGPSPLRADPSIHAGFFFFVIHDESVARVALFTR